MRPIKDFRFKVVSGSLQIFRKGIYKGCIPIKKLYQMVENKQDNGIGGVMVQEPAVSENLKKCSCGIKDVDKQKG